MHRVFGLLFRCLGWMFGAGIGGCTLALVMGVAEEIKLTVAEYAAQKRKRGRRYRCFLLVLDSSPLKHAFIERLI